MRKSLATAFAAGLAVTATASQAATPCLTPDEAGAVFVVIAPPVIRETAKLCAPQLGAGSYLAVRGESLAMRYEAAGTAAWPLAISGIVKIADTKISDPQVLKSLIPALIGPALISKMKPETCQQVDRMLGYLDPLPPQNTAGLIVQILQLAPSKESKSLPLCRPQPN